MNIKNVRILRKLKPTQLTLIAFVVSVLGTVSFAVLTPEQIKNLVSAAVLGVRAEVDIFLGTCEQDDKRRVHDLLVQFRGCQLTDADAASPNSVIQKYCIDQLISSWSSIRVLDCKKSLLRDTERLLQKNLIKQLEWVAKTEDSRTSDERLVVFLDHLSYWENETRDSLYLRKELIVDSAEGIDPFYQALSQDINQIHSKIGQLGINKVNFENLGKKKFLEKEPPFALVLSLLQKQEKPGSISLIHFTAMTLNSLVDRAKLFLNVFDLSCSIQGKCSPDVFNNSEAYLAILLTSMLGEDELNKPYIAALLRPLHAESKQIYKSIFDNREMLIDALRSGMNNKTVAISNAEIEQFEPLAFYLVSLLKETKRMVQTMNTSGRFLLTEKEYLGPFTLAELAKSDAFLNSLKISLQTSVDTYNERSAKVVQQAVQSAATESRNANTAALIKEVGFELRNAQLDLQGYQVALQKESGALGKLISRSNELISNKSYINRFATGNAEIFAPILNVSAQQALFTGQNNLGSYAVTNAAVPGAAVSSGPFTLDLQKGDLVSIIVKGRYSPTCAISKEYTGVQGLSQSDTGPEGFSMSSSNRNLQAISATDTDGDRQTDSQTDNFTKHLDGCGSNSIGASLSVSHTIGASAGILFVSGSSSHGISFGSSFSHSIPDDCKNRVKSTSKVKDLAHTNAKTTSSDLIQQASFERGMRSQFAPFPTLPVGALLAIEVGSENHQVLQTRVVHRDSVFSATQTPGNASKLYFVVNDCMSEDPSSSLLTVNIRHTRSPVDGSVVQFLMDAVSTVSQKMTAEFLTYIAQGDISGQELSHLRMKMQTEIGTLIATGAYGAFKPSDFPLIDEMIQTWIHSELSQLERRIKIRQIERKIELLYVKHTDLVNQSLNLDRENVLQEMIVDWSIKNLDFKGLLTEVQQVIQFLNYRAFPVLETVSPGVARSAAADFNAFVSTIDLNTDLKEVAKELIAFITKLKFSQAITLLTREQTNNKLVVSFPRTIVSDDGRPPVYQASPIPDGGNSYHSSSRWASVTYAEASRVWNDFKHKKQSLSFKVDVNDIYKSNTHFGGALHCQQRAPFVNSMSVFFVSDSAQYNDALNSIEPSRRTFLPDTVSIPNPSGMEIYPIISKSFQVDSIPIRFANQAEVLKIFSSGPLSASKGPAHGISPLGIFTLKDLTAAAFYEDRQVKVLLDEIDEILLVFQYDSLSSTEPLRWIQNCATAD